MASSLSSLASRVHHDFNAFCCINGITESEADFSPLTSLRYHSSTRQIMLHWQMTQICLGLLK
jgi:hypothetical protein